MDYKILDPIEADSSDEDKLFRELRSFFRAVVYKPLIDVIKSKGVIQNSRDSLIIAIRS